MTLIIKAFICFLATFIFFINTRASALPYFEFQPIKSIPMRAEWNRFYLLVWQFQTDILKDFLLYQKVGIGGFHIDRGVGQIKKIQFSLDNKFPYYVDHLADKGFLYLKDGNISAVTGKHGLATRPNSLADPATIEKIKSHIEKNINEAKKGLVLAYAFDDEISLGSFVNPCDVDIHPLSLAWFRKWLEKRYGSIDALNREWDSTFKSFDEVTPKGYEMVRNQLGRRPISDWNLSPWMDFRQFMDFQLASVLADLTRFANTLDPKTPAGFVGAQGPGPWGGYDFALLSQAVQWMENYDVHASDEILRSWWNQERRPRMKTFFSTKDKKKDSWFLWYMLVHGNQAVIAWPEGWFRVGGSEIAPHIEALRDVFVEIQGPVSRPFVDQNSRFMAEPIGIYYSHPSLQVGWAMDAATHGKTWPNRKGSIDDQNQTMGVLRKVWCKTLEDLGYQYDFINYLDVREDRVALTGRFKVIVLPRVVCLSDKEAQKLRRFVEGGGILVADALCGLMDEHGKGRKKGALDDLFEVNRGPDAGILNGKGITEIDGEKYEKPFLERFTYYPGAYRHNGIVVFERGLKHGPKSRGVEIREVMGFFHRASVMVESNLGKGKAIYLNLTPLEYWAPERRFGDYGESWRKIIGSILVDAGLQPRVVIYERRNRTNMIEAIFWEKGKNQILALVKNPSENSDLSKISGLNQIEGVTGEPFSIFLEFPENVALYNLRNGEALGIGRVFEDRFNPWEANIYRVVHEKYF